MDKKKKLQKLFDAKSRIIEVATEQGVSVPYALATVAQESSFKHDAQPVDKKTGKLLSSAYGLFQFTDSAWKDYGVKPGSKKSRDPETQVKLGIQRIKEAQIKMRDAVGREPTNGELYLSHVFGPTGGAVLGAAKPNESLLSALTRAHGGSKGANRALSSNPWLRKQGIANVGQLKSYMEKKVAKRVTEIEPIIQAHAVGKTRGPDQTTEQFTQPEDVPEDVTNELVSKFTGVKTDEGVSKDLVKTIQYEVTDEGALKEKEPKYQPEGVVSSKDFIKGRKQVRPDLNVPSQKLDNPAKLTDVQPYRPVTIPEEQENNRKLREETPGYLEAMKLIAKNDFSVSWALDGHDDYKPDENWHLSEDWLKENAADIPAHLWEDISYSWSEAHAKGLLDRIRQNMDYEDKLSKLGVDGMALRFAVNIFDPITAPLIVASGGLGLSAKIAKVASRTSRAAIYGGVGLTESAAIEALLVSQKPLGEAQDIAYAAAGGFLLGAGLGSLVKGPDIAPELDRMVKAAQATRNDVLDHIQSPGALSAGANSYRTPISDTAAELLNSTAHSPESALNKFRFDSQGRLGASKNSIFRHLGNLLGQNTVGNKDGSLVGEAATEYQQSLSDVMASNFAKDVRTEYDIWAKRTGVRYWDRTNARAEFMDRVSIKMRDRLGLINEDPEVVRAASKTANLYKGYLKLAQDPGFHGGKALPPVKGFDNISGDVHYVPRFTDHSKLGNMLDTYGNKKVGELYARAIRAATPSLSKADSLAIGHAYLKTLIKSTVPDMSVSRALAGEDMDGLRHMLVVEGGLDDKTFGRFFNMFTAIDDKAGKHSRAKSRQIMHENYRATMTTIGGERREVGISDLLVNDAEKLFNIYNRQMSGAVALARSGFSSKSELESTIRKGAEAADLIPGYDSHMLRRDTNRAEFLGTMVLGSPVGDFGKKMFAHRSSQSGEIAKLIRDYNFVRIMNQVGFAQLGETFNILGTVGIKTAMSNMPALKSFLRDAKTGQIRDDLSRELESIFGIGTDRLRNSSLFRHDDFGDFIEPNSGSKINQVRGALETGKRITADISMMTQINNGLQRWATRAISQKFADAMKNPKKMWSERRLAQAGLTRQDVSDIAAQMDRHSTAEKGVLTNHKLTQLNFDKWDNPQVKEKFRVAVNRISKQIIQENDPGNMHEWMSNPLVQMITQFRTFMIVSHGKQLLNGLHARDINTTQAFLGTMISASMAYALQQSVMSLGRPDGEAYREEKLSISNIAKGGFARAGFASMIPFAVDNMAVFLEADPIFDSRASGLSSAGIGQNPTTQFLQDGMKTLSSVAGAALFSDESFTEKDGIRAKQTLVPWQNAMGIDQGLRTIMSVLPEKD